MAIPPYGLMPPFGRTPMHTQPPKNNLDQIRAERYAEVMAHEQAHKSAGGKFAGSIHIEYDRNGIATGGHVPIQMPGLDPRNPEQTYSDAKVVFGAAMAPGADASGADRSVAAQAQAAMGQAQVLMAKKRQQTS